jgi:hypothetical protein
MNAVEYSRKSDKNMLGSNRYGLTDGTKIALGIPLGADGRYIIQAITIPDGYRMVRQDERTGIDCTGLLYYSNATQDWHRANACASPGTHYVVPVATDIAVTVKVNGKPVDPSTLSAETWDTLRNKGTQ